MCSSFRYFCLFFVGVCLLTLPAGLSRAESHSSGTTTTTTVPSSNSKPSETAPPKNPKVGEILEGISDSSKRPSVEEFSQSIADFAAEDLVSLEQELEAKISDAPEEDLSSLKELRAVLAYRIEQEKEKVSARRTSPEKPRTEKSNAKTDQGKNPNSASGPSNLAANPAVKQVMEKAGMKNPSPSQWKTFLNDPKHTENTSEDFKKISQELRSSNRPPIDLDGASIALPANKKGEVEVLSKSDYEERVKQYQSGAKKLGFEVTAEGLKFESTFVDLTRLSKEELEAVGLTQVFESKGPVKINGNQLLVPLADGLLMPKGSFRVVGVQEYAKEVDTALKSAGKSGIEFDSNGSYQFKDPESQKKAFQELLKPNSRLRDDLERIQPGLADQVMTGAIGAETINSLTQLKTEKETKKEPPPLPKAGRDGKVSETDQARYDKEQSLYETREAAINKARIADELEAERQSQLIRNPRWQNETSRRFDPLVTKAREEARAATDKWNEKAVELASQGIVTDHTPSTLQRPLRTLTQIDEALRRSTDNPEAQLRLSGFKATLLDRLSTNVKVDSKQKMMVSDSLQNTGRGAIASLNKAAVEATRDYNQLFYADGKTADSRDPKTLSDRDWQDLYKRNERDFRDAVKYLAEAHSDYFTTGGFLGAGNSMANWLWGQDKERSERYSAALENLSKVNQRLKALATADPRFQDLHLRIETQSGQLRDSLAKGSEAVFNDLYGTVLKRGVGGAITVASMGLGSALSGFTVVGSGGSQVALVTGRLAMPAADYSLKTAGISALTGSAASSASYTVDYAARRFIDGDKTAKFEASGLAKSLLQGAIMGGLSPSFPKVSEAIGAAMSFNSAGGAVDAARGGKYGAMASEAFSSVALPTAMKAAGSGANRFTKSFGAKSPAAQHGKAQAESLPQSPSLPILEANSPKPLEISQTLTPALKPPTEIAPIAKPPVEPIVRDPKTGTAKINRDLPAMSAPEIEAKIKAQAQAVQARQTKATELMQKANEQAELAWHGPEEGKAAAKIKAKQYRDQANQTLHEAGDKLHEAKVYEAVYEITKQDYGPNHKVEILSMGGNFDNTSSSPMEIHTSDGKTSTYVPGQRITELDALIRVTDSEGKQKLVLIEAKAGGKNTAQSRRHQELLNMDDGDVKLVIHNTPIEADHTRADGRYPKGMTQFTGILEANQASHENNHVVFSPKLIKSNIEAYMGLEVPPPKTSASETPAVKNQHEALKVKAYEESLSGIAQRGEQIWNGLQEGQVLPAVAIGFGPASVNLIQSLPAEVQTRVIGFEKSDRGPSSNSFGPDLTATNGTNKFYRQETNVVRDTEGNIVTTARGEIVHIDKHTNFLGDANPLNIGIIGGNGGSSADIAKATAITANQQQQNFVLGKSVEVIGQVKEGRNKGLWEIKVSPTNGSPSKTVFAEKVFEGTGLGQENIAIQNPEIRSEIRAAKKSPNDIGPEEMQHPKPFLNGITVTGLRQRQADLQAQGKLPPGEQPILGNDPGVGYEGKPGKVVVFAGNGDSSSMAVELLAHDQPNAIIIRVFGNDTNQPVTYKGPLSKVVPDKNRPEMTAQTLADATARATTVNGVSTNHPGMQVENIIKNPDGTLSLQLRGLKPFKKPDGTVAYSREFDPNGATKVIKADHFVNAIGFSNEGALAKEAGPTSWTRLTGSNGTTIAAKLDTVNGQKVEGYYKIGAAATSVSMPDGLPVVADKELIGKQNSQKVSMELWAPKTRETARTLFPESTDTARRFPSLVPVPNTIQSASETVRFEMGHLPAPLNLPEGFKVSQGKDAPHYELQRSYLISGINQAITDTKNGIRLPSTTSGDGIRSIHVEVANGNGYPKFSISGVQTKEDAAQIGKALFANTPFLSSIRGSLNNGGGNLVVNLSFGKDGSFIPTSTAIETSTSHLANLYFSAAQKNQGSTANIALGDKSLVRSLVPRYSIEGDVNNTIKNWVRSTLPEDLGRVEVSSEMVRPESGVEVFRISTDKGTYFARVGQEGQHETQLKYIAGQSLFEKIGVETLQPLRVAVLAEADRKVASNSPSPYHDGKGRIAILVKGEGAEKAPLRDTMQNLGASQATSSPEALRLQKQLEQSLRELGTTMRTVHESIPNANDPQGPKLFIERERQKSIRELQGLREKGIVTPEESRVLESQLQSNANSASQGGAKELGVTAGNFTVDGILIRSEGSPVLAGYSNLMRGLKVEPNGLKAVGDRKADATRFLTTLEEAGKQSGVSPQTIEILRNQFITGYNPPGKPQKDLVTNDSFWELRTRIENAKANTENGKRTREQIRNALGLD